MLDEAGVNFASRSRGRSQANPLDEPAKRDFYLQTVALRPHFLAAYMF